MKKGFERPLRKHIPNVDFLIKNKPQKPLSLEGGLNLKKKKKTEIAERTLRKEAKKTQRILNTKLPQLK